MRDAGRGYGMRERDAREGILEIEIIDAGRTPEPLPALDSLVPHPAPRISHPESRIPHPAICLLSTLLLLTTPAGAEEVCTYRTSSGAVRQANGLNQVPSHYRRSAQCAQSGTVNLAAPDEIKLAGLVRRESMASSVGRIQLQWSREIEDLFGKSPVRAMADAASAVSRALKSAAFPLELRTLDMEWKVIFLDENLPTAQIPQYLITSCHPGWMTPPSNIYIVAQRIAAGCGGNPPSAKNVTDSQLARVLIHEMGHAVEALILSGSSADDRLRGEGFASWFEQYASNYSGVIPRGSVEADYAKLAGEHRKSSPDRFEFDGSAQSYARASTYFQAIVDRRGIGGLMDVYERMKRDGIEFIPAVQQVTGWSPQQLDEAGGKAGR